MQPLKSSNNRWKLIIKVYLLSSLLFGCSSNNPIRTAKTIPSKTSYHNFGLEFRPLKVKWNKKDSNGAKQNYSMNKYSPTATYSYRRGLFKLMEFEIGLGAGMIFGGASAWLKIPLTKGSNGYGIPYKRQISKFGTSLALGSIFVNDFTSVDGWGEYEFIGAYYFSYDILQNFEKKSLFTLFSGIEGFYGFEGISKLQDNRHDFDSVGWNKYGIKIPFGISFCTNNLITMVGTRILIPINYNHDVYDGDKIISDGTVENITSLYGIIINVSFSFNANKG